MENGDKLKMKFKLHQLEFEIEGNEDTVKDQFENFKSFITEDLLPKVNVERVPSIQQLDPSKQSQLTQHADAEIIDSSEIPSLKDIKLRDLAKSETDWLIVYAFYSSDSGQREFTRADLIEQYQNSDRHTDKRINGLSQYIKTMAKAEYIKATNDSEFILLSKGKERAYEIFQGKSKSKGSKGPTSNKTDKPSKAKSPSKTGGSQKFDFALDKSLNLRPDGKESLKDFASKYDMDSTPKQITIIVFYLKNVLNIREVNGNHIYTGLDELDVRIPSSLRQIIVNTKGRRYGWLDYESMDDISLSVQGRNAVKHDLIKDS